MSPTSALQALQDAVARGEADIGFSAPEHMIAEAEHHLGVHFPPSYRDFVHAVGYCKVGGHHIYGITKTGLSAKSVPSVVFATDSARQTGGMPSALLLVEHSGGDEIFVIDTRRLRPDGEAPVAVWMPEFHDSSELPVIAPDFGSYLIDAVADASDD